MQPVLSLYRSLRSLHPSAAPTPDQLVLGGSPWAASCLQGPHKLAPYLHEVRGALQVVKDTGLDMQHARMSGNPVLWRQPNGSQVLLGMVHARAAR